MPSRSTPPVPTRPGPAPDRPYQDRRVSVHVEDGRRSCTTPTRYDLVLFAIPDSLTVARRPVVAPARELPVHARSDPGGPRPPRARTASCRCTTTTCRSSRSLRRYADRVFGEPPCLDLSPGSGPRPRTVLTASIDPATSCATRVVPAAEIVLRRPTISRSRTSSDAGSRGFYLVTLLAILLDPLVAVPARAGPFPQMRPYVDLFFMGAAFLLLETTNVVRFALCSARPGS